MTLAGTSFDLDPFNDASDVEIALSTVFEKALRQKKPRQASSAAASLRHRPQVLAQSAEKGRASLARLLDAFGPEFFAGQSLALSRSLIVDGLPGRLEIQLHDRALRKRRIYVREERR